MDGRGGSEHVVAAARLLVGFQSIVPQADPALNV
jgi:hypothetical protein